MNLALAAVIALLILESVRADVISSPAENQAVAYVASVGFGSPATDYNLIVDTGSSNTWVGAGKAYVPTSTSRKTADKVSEDNIRVEYGSGSFSGAEYIDQVTIASGLVVSQQSIGVASTSKGFNNVDGILGLGPTDLTKGTLSPDTGLVIPTVSDNLFSGGTISANEFAISFEPITDSSGTQMNGEISWGGTDSSKFTGVITFAPITSTSPASNYWGIDASASYGNTMILSTTAGIVDTGTTLLLLATDAFKKYQSATGAVPDQATSLLSITSDQFANLQPLFFEINGATFELTANAQIWPRSLNTNIGGTAGNIYLIVQDIGTNSGSGLDFILGQAFIERFYTVYDTANARVGIATTPFTDATTN
ncbi:hypothetical protein BG000_002582 [Podila horticola]|nr:hypothetical protein BG000_002582 [Podila horticola]